MPILAILISQYWKPMVIAVVVASGFAYSAILIRERDDARRKIVDLTGEATALQSSNRAMSQTIDRQNAAVAELKARADAAANAMGVREEAALRKGAAEESIAEQHAHALTSAAIPGEPGCDSAIRWGNQAAGELATW